MKIATCIADLESFICEECSRRSLVAGEVIAQWTTGEDIRVVGKWQGKGYFKPLCVRWVSGDCKGMFGKGLAGYTGEIITHEQIGHLPTVK